MDRDRSGAAARAAILLARCRQHPRATPSTRAGFLARRQSDRGSLATRELHRRRAESASRGREYRNRAAAIRAQSRSRCTACHRQESIVWTWRLSLYTTRRHFSIGAMVIIASSGLQSKRMGKIVIPRPLLTYIREPFFSNQPSV